MAINIISLNGIQLWGYHGCLPEERKIGSKYIVDLSLSFDTSSAEKSDSLHDTIDYSSVYEIIKNEFAKPVNLIEHLARRILDAIHNKFLLLDNSTIMIQKINPPISGEIHSASIRLSYK
ncbi:dihydroneopterin aldolase [Bacteroidales bacterium OttesenSCG-928-K03]|nr:dihydroneopterin aldolase [Odoribacter sp. OttesenSCG-928-L07]MDL2239002.1 dihydroneopterin aldolase [Bacteroidales bacterium OttesenSCG-928-L14]MDL2240710.1 dihydroneopterin aldolase [Bacteroidales bacterium OttesenSCG-928-K22]MDL2242160.1 dihydroneopterin aldolase [Bacteroidales bacterium OttesenSCG-928-K03]